jgi:DNA (cytosine-5)-methyltransferase 1
VDALEIFSGAGGMAIGAHRAGFCCKAMFDNSQHVFATLQENASNKFEPMFSADIVKADIRETSFKKYNRSVALLFGGPPCQPFSQGGLRLHFRDSRNMFPEALRALDQIRPEAFLFENVRGLATGRAKNYAELVRMQLENPAFAKTITDRSWEDQLTILEDATTSRSRTKRTQYNVVKHIMNAADYGVPQKRERIFFAGFRSDLRISWHFPLPTHSKLALLKSQFKNGDYWDLHSIPKSKRQFVEPFEEENELSNLKPWRTVRSALEDLPKLGKPSSGAQQISDHIFIPGARSYRGHTGSRLDEPSKAIKAGVHGVPGGENMVQCDDGTVRYFTIRECARLQTFPDIFQFTGPWSEKVRQIGNAVPCLLAETILRSMQEALKKQSG